MDRPGNCIDALSYIYKSLFYGSVTMMPNLFEATNTYWRELNKLEAAYQRHELSLQEVDARVAALMAALGQERRAAFASSLNGLRYLWQEQREPILGVSLLGVLTYAWVAFNYLT